MATWKESFKAAGLVVVYSVLWWIVGGFISFLGLFGLADIGRRSMAGIETGTGETILAFLFLLAGFVIINLGTSASFFKVFGEFLRDELKEG